MRGEGVREDAKALEVERVGEDTTEGEEEEGEDGVVIGNHGGSFVSVAVGVFAPIIH